MQGIRHVGAACDCATFEITQLQVVFLFMVLCLDIW